jgi:hypothetical protein
MASGSAAMKARWGSGRGRGKRKVDMRNLSAGGRLGVERAPKAKVSFAVGAFSTATNNFHNSGYLILAGEIVEKSRPPC